MATATFDSYIALGNASAPTSYPLLGPWSPWPDGTTAASAYAMRASTAWTSTISLPSPAPPLFAPPPPAPSLDGSRYSVPEYLTRRFVEKATQNRLRLLKKRLHEQGHPRAAPWKQHSVATAGSSLDGVSASGSHAAQPRGRPRALTPPPQRTRPASATLHGAHARGAAPRARSASPSAPTLRAATATWVAPRNLLVNDFIQVPVAGTYRHIEKQYGTDYATVEERLMKLERWCKDFKQTYSPGSPAAVTHARRPSQRQQLPYGGQASVLGPAALEAGSVHFTERTVTPPRVNVTPPLRPKDSVASTVGAASSSSPASTVVYSPAFSRDTFGGPPSVMGAGGHDMAPWAAAGGRASVVTTASPPSMWGPPPLPFSPPVAADPRGGGAPSDPHAAVAGSPTHATLTVGRSGYAAPLPLNPDVPPARHVDARLRGPATLTLRPAAVASASSPVPAVLTPHRTTPPPRAALSPSPASPWPGAAAAARSDALSGDPFAPQQPGISSTVVQAGTSVASQGSLDAFSDETGAAWEQMYLHPTPRPTWVEPQSLVPRASLHKFGASATAAAAVQRAHLGGGTGGREALRQVGLSHRERLQAGIRDLQAEMQWLRRDMGLQGIAVPTIAPNVHRAATPPPGKMWG